VAKHLFGRVKAVDRRAEFHQLAVAKAQELRAPIAHRPARRGMDCAQAHERRRTFAFDQNFLEVHW